MKEKFVQGAFHYLDKHGTYSELEKKKFRYSLEVIYTLVTKVSVIIIVSLLLGTWKETLLFMLIYSLLRGFSFGIHATKNLYCWLTTIPVYAIIPLLAKHLDIPLYILMIGFSICFIILAIYAPADTPSHPLIREKQRKNAKISTIILCSLLGISLYFIPDHFVKNTIFLALVTQAICVHPFTYKTFKVSYHNYKNYKKSITV